MADGTQPGSLEKHREWVARVFASGRIPHGILLAGAPGSGKLTLALEMARRFLCHAPDPGSRPCGTCIACREMLTLRYPDLILFSSRDVVPEVRALTALASRAVETPAGRDRLIQAVRRLFYRVVNRVNGGYFKPKEASGTAGKKRKTIRSGLQVLKETRRDSRKRCRGCRQRDPGSARGDSRDR